MTEKLADPLGGDAPDFTDSDKNNMIAQAAMQLGEVCESVQILASWRTDGGGTSRCFNGRGNWFARTGMARQFLDEDRGSGLASQIGRLLDE